MLAKSSSIIYLDYSLWLKQNGEHFSDDIWKRVFFNRKINWSVVLWIIIHKMSAMFQKWLDAEQAKSHLVQWLSSLLTNICVTRLQWVNKKYDNKHEKCSYFFGNRFRVEYSIVKCHIEIDVELSVKLRVNDPTWLTTVEIEVPLRKFVFIFYLCVVHRLHGLFSCLPNLTYFTHAVLVDSANSHRTCNVYKRTVATKQVSLVVTQNCNRRYTQHASVAIKVSLSLIRINSTIFVCQFRQCVIKEIYAVRYSCPFQ